MNCDTETAGSMIELAYGEGRMSCINRAAARGSDLPDGLGPHSADTTNGRKDPGHMMPRVGCASLRTVTNGDGL